MKAWISEQSEPVYWIATAKSYQDAVNGIPSLNNATPLFTGDMYAQVMSLSPWIVAPESLLDIDDSILTCGIFITSNAGLENVLAHLRSLLTAGLFGEEVLFRFYDPQVIFPMFERMGTAERNAFMGNTSSWTHFNNDKALSYSSIPNPDFKISTSAWWVIKESHLTEPENVDVLAKNLERRFWEKLPDVMNVVDSPLDAITATLIDSKERGFGGDEAQFRALALIVHQGQGKAEDATRALLLSSEGEQKLKNFMKEYV